MVKAKVFVYAKPFEGSAKIDNFNLVEEELPALEDGEFLAEAAFLSIDPYMRAFAHELTIGQTFYGYQIARIIESSNPDFPVGRYVHGAFGWRTYTISKETYSDTVVLRPFPYLVPDYGDLSPSLALGVLGSTGITAYFGLLDILNPKAGETLVVSAAAGSVGSLVGQIAKIKRMKVIGIVGSDAKGKWITEELGFDQYINYKTKNVSTRLQQLVPEGVDCYFDNVGGDVANAVLQNMKKNGRVSVCGLISTYNGDHSQAFCDHRPVLFKELKIQGFLADRWNDRKMEAFDQIKKWMKEEKIKCKENIFNGFENMPYAFVELMNGSTTGKAVVKT